MDRNSSLVRAESVPTEWEASLLVQLLSDEGIRAKAIGGFTAGFLAESPGYVSVMVDSKDETRAREICHEYFQSKIKRLNNDPHGSAFATERETENETSSGDETG